MKINNENENIKNIFLSKTIHVKEYMFSYKYSTYQIFMDTCNETEHINL